MKQSGAPLPSVAAPAAIVIEFFGAIALTLGVWIWPLAVLFAFFALAAGRIARWVAQRHPRGAAIPSIETLGHLLRTLELRC